MQTRSPILVGTAIALAMGLSLDMIRKDARPALDPIGVAPASVMRETATYLAPRLDGVNLDVRMMGHVRADPLHTAERFCRDRGYTSVADLTVRASTVTRTIADGAVHAGPGHAALAFAMIRCQSLANATETG